MVAMGCIPFFLAVSLDIRIMEAAAAFKGEEFPAVTTPSGLNAGLRSFILQMWHHLERPGLDPRRISFRLPVLLRWGGFRL